MSVFTSGPGTVASDATLTTTDVTTNDVSTSKHGFAPKAPNDTTKFLRGDATYAAPSAGYKMNLSFPYETSARNLSNVSGGGVSTFGGSGVALDTSASANSHVRIRTALNWNGTIDIFSNNPAFGLLVGMDTIPASDNPEFFGGLGTVVVDSSGHTWTGRHVGFQLKKVSGSFNLYGTQADGTTQEKTTALITGVGVSDALALYCTVVSGTSATFYFSQNGAAWSAGTTLSTNPPLATQNDYNIQVSSSNLAVAERLYLFVSSFFYSR